MGMLTSHQVRRLIGSHCLINPGKKPDSIATDDMWLKSWQDRIQDIESGAFDCTLEGVCELDPNTTPYLGMDTRRTPDNIPVEPMEPQGGDDDRKAWLLIPGRYYLIQAREVFRFPMFLTGFLDTRTTVFRSGYSVDIGPVQAGFSDKLTFGVVGHHNRPMVVRECARCITLRFALFASDGELEDALSRRVIGNDRNHGNWTDGRMGTCGLVEKGY